MKPSFITFDSFKKILILISYLEESASCMLKMLLDIPDLSSCQLAHDENCEEVLLGIRERSQKLKTDLIDAIKEKCTFSDKIGNMDDYYVIIPKDLTELYSMMEHILDVEYFVDPQGDLIKKIIKR